jgi:hypothetical protein
VTFSRVRAVVVGLLGATAVGTLGAFLLGGLASGLGITVFGLQGNLVGGQGDQAGRLGGMAGGWLGVPAVVPLRGLSSLGSLVCHRDRLLDGGGPPEVWEDGAARAAR